MAQDFSRQQQRRQATERITNNRDALIPTKRIDQAPDAIVAADLRNAYRGNPADEIRRALGMVDDAAQAIHSIDLDRTKKQAEKDYASGGMDATGGAEMDPAKKGQLAYQRGYYKINFAAKQQQFESEIANEARTMVNAGKSPEEIHAYVLDRTKEHVGEINDLYPLDEIKSDAAERIGRFTGDLDAKLNAAIRERTDEEMIETAVATYQGELRDGHDVDTGASIQRLVDAGIAPKVARERFVEGAIAVAQDQNDPTLLPRIFGITFNDTKAKADGAAAATGGAGLATDFTSATTRMLEREGGYTPSDGASKAPAKYGINQKANPDINVATLTPEQAAKLYKERYWDAIGADNLPPAIRELAFDTAVNHGVGRAKTLIAKANGDPKKLIALRRAEYARLAKDPDYAPSAKGWEARLKAFETDLAAGAPVGDPMDGAVAAVTADPKNRMAFEKLPPDVQARILNAQVQVEGLSERADNKRKADNKDALLTDIYTAGQNGQIIDDKIDAAVARGDIDAADGMALRNANRSVVEQRNQGSLNDDLLTDYQLALAEVTPNYDAIRSKATRDYSAGLFGTGQKAAEAYLHVMNATATGARSERSLSAQQKAAIKPARGYVSQTLKPLAPGPGMKPDADKARVYALAMQDFEARLAAKDADPMKVADDIVSTWGPRLNATTRPANATARGIGKGTAPAAPTSKVVDYDPVSKTFK